MSNRHCGHVYIICLFLLFFFTGWRHARSVAFRILRPTEPMSHSEPREVQPNAPALPSGNGRSNRPPNAPTNAPTVPVSALRRSSCQTRAPLRLIEDMHSYASNHWEILDIPDYGIQTAMDDPIAFAASSDPHTMHLHESTVCN
jgi:hypothetical protein